MSPATLTFASRYERLFYAALRIRMVEEKISEIYPSDQIRCPVHLSIGQEALAVGVCESLATQDLVFCTYRSHAFYIAKGGSLPVMFAELYGRVGGMAKGKAGSMHLAAPEVGIMGSSAVVATTIPHAVGAALAAARRKTGQISVNVFGDGATEEGVYHESLNFAALHQLPVLFICENNGLAIHATRQERGVYNITEHARTYGIESTCIPEGYDPQRVGDVAGAAIAAMRRDGRPRLLEIMTFRTKEHVGIGEDYEAGYRSRAALEAWQSQDPLLTDTALAERWRPVLDAEIAAAVAFAVASPEPGPEELLADVL